MTLQIPKIIGHRGCAAYAPENTLEGIHTAADMGIEWVELDVKLTKDEVPIIFHDETLERTTNGSGNVADMNYAEIKELDAGSWFGESFIGAKIPTLEEAVEVLLQNNMGLNLEVKPCPGREVLTAEVALDELANIWDDHNRLLISSFQHVSLETAMDLATDWHRALLLDEEWPDNWQDLAKHFQISTLNISGDISMTPDRVAEAKAFGKPLLAYTVNDEIRARDLCAWGVDGFFSDAPDVLEELFQLH